MMKVLHSLWKTKWVPAFSFAGSGFVFFFLKLPVFS